MIRKPTRPGVTLTEVLVAMFVMALGMTALLTLFPLGAFQIAQALKDDRCGQTAMQADGIVRTFWRHSVVAPLDSGQQPNAIVWALDDPNLLWRRPSLPAPSPNGLSEPAGRFVNVYLSPGGAHSLDASWMPNTTNGNPISSTAVAGDRYLYNSMSEVPPPTHTPAVALYGVPVPRADVSSYPVLLDPVGFHGRPTSNLREKVWAGFNTPGFPASRNALRVPRRTFGALPSLSFINPGAGPGAAPIDPITPTQFAAYSQCFLTDDMTFEVNAAPMAMDPSTGAPTASNNLQRQGRFSWSAMIQRPHNNKQTIADLTILVFDGRAPFTIPPQEEIVVPASLTVGSRTMAFSAPTRTAEQSPLVRKGGWVMDGTIATINMNQAGAPNPVAVRVANFYRIVGVTEANVTPGGNTDYVLDLETPVQPIRNGPTTYSSYVDAPAVPLSYTASIYLFANLAEVFPRPPLTDDQ